jgi:hypothetical protein
MTDQLTVRWPCGCQYVGLRRVAFCRLHGVEDYLRWKRAAWYETTTGIILPDLRRPRGADSGRVGI